MASTGASGTELASAAVSCPLCGLDYVPGGRTCREKGCPVALGGCATRHCPRCGYTMPDLERSTAARLVRRLLGGSGLGRAARSPEGERNTRSLAELPAGSSAVIDHLEGDPALLARLTAQGLAPGVAIHVLQRAPTHVIELGHTTVAVERRVAETIVVRQ